MSIHVYKDGKITGNNSLGGSYDGEKQMGTLYNMPLFSSDANKILCGSYGLLSTRSTTLYHTYGAVKSAINKQVEYAIGGGLVFRSQPDWQALGIDKDVAKEWGKKFQKIVHYRQKKMNMYEKQSVVFRSALYEGDSLLFFERKDGKLSDLIDSPGSQIDWQYNKDNHTLGIKTDSLLRRKGIRKIDGTEVTFTDQNGDQNVVQFYLKDLSRQLRGYPLAYSVINIARNHDTFADAITNRVVLEASMFGVAKTSTTDVGKQIANMANANKKNKVGIVERVKGLVKKANVENIGTGGIFDLNTDENFEFTDVKTPSNNYDPFKKWTLNDIAMGTGTPPEVILSKYESSFTAHKGALNDFVKSFTKKRKTFEQNVMDVVIREIAKDSVLSGLIEAPGFFDNEFIQDAYLQGMYLHPIVGHINPLQEVNAQIKEVNAGFDLRSNMAARRGNEWDNFFPEWGEEQEDYTGVSTDYVARKIYEKESGNNA